MESVPYFEESNNEFFIRTFKEYTPSGEFKWHFDDENRKIIPISGHNWKIQIDESLPEELIIGKEYFIPVDVYHRIIKGDGDLELKLFKLDSKKGDQPKYVRKYNDNPKISDYLMYHLQNEIPLNENVFRYASEAWCDLIQEAKSLYEEGILDFSEEELEIINEDTGKIKIVDGERFILNTPFINTNKDIDKKYFVYICEDNNKIEKIYFDDGE
jgi:hypothetical protein